LCTSLVHNYTHIHAGWVKNSRSLHLAVYIFKTSEPICVIFGTLQPCFVLNTSFIEIQKFITEVEPPNHKVSNSVFICKIKRDHCVQMPMFYNTRTHLHKFWHNWTSWYFKNGDRYFIFINCL